MVLPIRIAGQDVNGKAFSQLSHTLNFCRAGALLGGVQTNLQVGSELTIEYKRHRGRFKVRWLDAVHGLVGVKNLDPEKFVFIELPEENYFDEVDSSQLREKGANGKPAAGPQPASAALPVVPGDSSAREKSGSAEAAPAALDARFAELRSRLHNNADDPDSALELVVKTAHTIFPASGAAVALQAGTDWVCRASSGVAPRVGVCFQSPQGLTGQAAASGEIVICHDTEQDPRVDAAIWRSVQLRSAASVPIMRGNGAAGVLELFSEQPNAFTEEQLPLLREFAQLLQELIGGFSAAPH